MSPPSPAGSSRLEPGAWLASILGCLLLAVLFYSPITAAMSTELDSSNYGSYAYFTAKGFQFGTEVVPMAGPYGFVPYGFTYSGHLYTKRLLVELLTKLCLAALVIWFFRRTPHRPVLRWSWLLATAFLAPLSTDGPYILAIFLSGLFLAENHLSPRRFSLPACCSVAAFLALLTLFKGTQTILAAATLGLLFMQAVISRDFRRLPWIVATFALTLVGLLLLAGQNPLHVLPYLHGVLELASGYNAAMSLDEPRPLFLVGLSISLLLATMVGGVLLAGRRDPVVLAGGLFIAGFTFTAWKHGFVRSDGHVTIFFHYACIAALTVLLFFERTATAFAGRWQRVATHLLALIVVGLALRGDGQQLGQRYQWLREMYQDQMAASWQQLTAPRETRARFDRELAKLRFEAQFSNLQALVGDARIDFFGYEQGYLMLNRFNYRPRPMGGGTFNVFTPWLQQINVAYLMDEAKRPEYFLVNLLTIDDRFLAQDDAGTLRALLANYAPHAAGSGLTLFKVRPGPPRLPEPRLLKSQALAWDQPVTVPEAPPGQMLLVSLQLPLNLAGRLRAFLYKPPLVFMDLAGPGIGRPTAQKIIPAMFRDPVPFTPLLEDSADLLELYQGKPGKRAGQFTLKTSGPACYDGGALTVNFYTMPRPESAPPAPVRLINAVVSKIDPFLLESPNTPLLRTPDLVAQILVPPGRMGFALQGDETMLHFTFGMDPVTYTRATDGADFIVELARPGQPAQILFQRHLAPRTRPADQGTHPVRLALPPFPPGTKLYLRVERGPDNDGAWDLGYYTGIDLARGPYLPAQFPGFSTLPRSVDADMCGSMMVNGHAVFMLNSPGALTFALQGREKTLHFTGGMLAGAYSGTGNSDGVEFLVDLLAPDGSKRRLLQARFNPRDHPADRTDRSFTVDLPALAPGYSLVVATAPGPAGSNAWDWSYLADLRIE